MKQSLLIQAIIDEPAFLEDLVEKLATRHNDSAFRRKKLVADQESIETSSTETYISGVFSIKNSGQQINMPFITSFLFTCTKESKDTYMLEWGVSLS